MIRNIAKVLRAAVKGGSPEFNKGEAAIVNSVVEALPSAEAAVLQNQAASVRLVQRQNGRHMVVAYYSKPELVGALPYGGYEYCLAKVTYTNKGSSP